MCQREYYHIAERLNTIKIDIKALKENQTACIMEKIQILKKTNSLLREQNKLLTLRQKELSKRRQQVA